MQASKTTLPPSKLNQAMTDYLRKNKNLLNIRHLERLIGTPKGTLRHAVVGTQPLPEKWAIPLAVALRQELYTKVLDNIETVAKLESQIEELVNADAI